LLTVPLNSNPSILFRLRRFLISAAAICGLLGLGYWLWNPGSDLRDGRHDRGRNGLWLAHGWLGADEWFTRHSKQSQLPGYRSPEALRSLAELCAKNHITDLFPHLCPCDPLGHIAPWDRAQTEKFLDALAPTCRVLPWIGGPSPAPADCHDPKWRATFCQSVRTLLDAHPRLHGVHLNIEPMRSGDADYLKLLDELRAVLPAGKLLSIAAYPPPTRWQPSLDVHWEEPFFRAVAQRSDQLAVMMYDTSITRPKFYRKLMSDWTFEILSWAGEKQVLLGLAAYNDAGVGYHHPDVENLEHGLAGIHAGLIRAGAPAHYQGAALYSHWEMDEADWKIWRERFLRPGKLGDATE
jgi:hypothetical protein